eukprot:scaffold34513_cov76-Cyclotella_meneghiniana.AAC.1
MDPKTLTNQPETVSVLPSPILSLVVGCWEVAAEAISIFDEYRLAENDEWEIFMFGCVFGDGGAKSEERWFNCSEREVETMAVVEKQRPKAKSVDDDGVMVISCTSCCDGVRLGRPPVGNRLICHRCKGWLWQLTATPTGHPIQQSTAYCPCDGGEAIVWYMGAS